MNAITKIICFVVVLLNLALNIVRLAIASRITNQLIDFVQSNINNQTSLENAEELFPDGDFNVATPELIESALQSAFIGITSCWICFHHIRGRRNFASTHGLDILAFLFAFYCLGYACKQINLGSSTYAQVASSVNSTPPALAGLSIIQPFIQLWQLIVIVLVKIDDEPKPAEYFSQSQPSQPPAQLTRETSMNPNI